MFSHTEFAQNVTDDMATSDQSNPYVVRHVYRDDQNRRCTAFYFISNNTQAKVLVEALNAGAK